MVGLVNQVPTVSVGMADFALAGGFGAQVVRKSVTFLNTVADVPLFTVTGDVAVRLFAICRASLTSAGGCNASVGVAGATATLIALTDVLDIDINEVWAAAIPATSVTALSVLPVVGYIVPAGQDILLTRTLQIDAGQLEFYCIWTALSAGATVVAA